MKRTKHGTSNVTARRRKQDPVTPSEALAMLESAVSYCQSAGLKVNAANGDNGTLGLFIPGAHYVLSDGGTRAAFRLGEFYPARNDAPTVSVHAETQNVGTSAREA